MTIDGGKTLRDGRGARRRTTTFTRSGSIRTTPTTSSIGNDGGVAVSYDMREDVDISFPTCRSDCSTMSATTWPIRTTSAAGCRTTTTGAGRARRVMSAGIMNYDWFQIQGGDGFVAIPDRRDSRSIYSESQDGNMIRRNKITGESKNIRPTAQNVTTGTRSRRDIPLPLGHADDVLAARSGHAASSAANRVFMSHDRGDSWTAISPDLTTNANRDTIVTMGLKGSGHQHLAQRRHLAVAGDRHARRVAEAGGRVLHRQRRRHGARVARRRQDVAEHHEEPAGLSAGRVRVAKSCRRATTRRRYTSRSTTIASTTTSRTSG